MIQSRVTPVCAILERKQTHMCLGRPSQLLCPKYAMQAVQGLDCNTVHVIALDSIMVRLLCPELVLAADHARNVVQTAV